MAADLTAPARADVAAPTRILVVGAFMHQPGHYATFPGDLASGFARSGAEVLLVHPFRAAGAPTRTPGVQTICLEQRQPEFNWLMRWAWRTFQTRPLWLCLFWIILHLRQQDYRFAYWTDFPADNQQSTWPLVWARASGLYRLRTAFSEHYRFSWQAHRWQRLLKLDRFRLRILTLFVHSEPLLDHVRNCMDAPDRGHYVPWGLNADPAHDEDRTEARRNLGLDPHARVLLVFGMQAIRRKEIDTLALALLRNPPTCPLIILFAGMKIQDEPHPFDAPEMRNLAQLQVRHLEAFIPEDQIKPCFAAADGVWAYYGSFIGASGVLAQAIAFGRVPICARNGEAGALCRRHQLGILPETDDLTGVSAALSGFIALPADEQARHEARCRQAAHAMSWPAVARTIMDTLQ